MREDGFWNGFGVDTLSLQFFFCLRFSGSFVIFDCFFVVGFNDVILSFVPLTFISLFFYSIFERRI